MQDREELFDSEGMMLAKIWHLEEE